MNERTKALQEAVSEARRFIQKATEALASDVQEPWPCWKRAAAKRASLDLTRALAKWRQAR
jgi:hypothetical protein